MRPSKKARLAVARRIDRAYGRACFGVLVSILDLPGIHAVGERAVAEGVDDAELERRLRAEAEKVRVR